ncbi:glycosyltransferase [Flexivirga meconopsidis]|uniref:glycosyltransferase n=1 Tax=Flexivirga meconopsidis TaxID=2977121 RepID=UPI0022408C0F|nr:glycosyltransferase [Flexivirga meconopsidis]
MPVDAGAAAEFDHFLITRFSAVFVPDQDPPDEDWLFYRLAFFLDALLPSVAGQQGAKARWLVFLDDRSSDEFRSAIEELAGDVFEPVWTHEMFLQALPRELAERSAAPYLISTRVDSDDALAVDFVETVQAQFDRQERLYVDFARGVQVDRAGAVYLHDQPSAAFQSLIERRAPGRLPYTIFGHPQHTQLRTVGPQLRVRTPPMWLQIVHGSNIANSIRGPRVSPDVIAQRFTIALGYDKQRRGIRLLPARFRSFGQLGVTWLRNPTLVPWCAEAMIDRMHGTRVRGVTPDPEPAPIRHARRLRDRLSKRSGR